MVRMLRPRPAALLLLAACGAALGGALFFEHVVGVTPCVLCVWQRWPYGAAAAVLLLGLVFGGPRWLPWALAAAALAFLVGGGIAVFHVGVEQQLWAGTPSCGVPAPDGGMASLEALRAEIFAQPIVRCDVVAWSLFGISLAGYNIGLSALFFAIAVAAVARARAGKDAA